ncbi:MAG: hypothetical protein ACI4CT_02095, partial [Lachnospiraceae bacterium]
IKPCHCGSWVFRKYGVKLALGELRSATGGLQTVLNILQTKKSLVFKHFLAFYPVLTYVLTLRNGGFHRLLFVESSVYSGI